MINIPYRANKYYEIRLGDSIKTNEYVWPTQVYQVHNVTTGVMELEVTSLFEALQYATFAPQGISQLLNAEMMPAEDEDDESSMPEISLGH